MINVASETDQDVESFAAGAVINKIADGYLDKMVKTSFTLKKSEKLNQRIYEQFVRGIGPFRQFVPVASRGNILDRPAREIRPL